ncbi:Chondroitinase AC precursor [hydrothermal vent metagenome]|uniref:Chondroitinase AC n=1 Tax=hydrothermal vent metagenome TaxID=652676 RepID=A0A3B0U9Y3_9ZZZZ
MKPYLLFVFFFLISFFIIGCSPQKVTYPDNLKQLHKNVIAYFLDKPAKEDVVDKLLVDLNEDGSWPDIDYTSKDRGAWKPRRHLTNLLEVVKAYQTRGTKFYHKKRVSKKIHLALNYWLTNDFQSPNWWFNEIGVPEVLASVLFLMEDELSPDQKELGVKILDRSKIGRASQNKVWLSGNVLLKALLIRDEETIKKASESIKEELAVGLDEGIQPDWSFHQHGPQLQFGTYGLSYVVDMIKYITILQHTPFKFDEDKVSTLRNYLLQGLQWVTWKNQMDISACGRQLFIDSPAQKATTFSNSIKKMETLDRKFAGDYKKAGRYETLVGNKHFWRSDFQVQRTPEYYFSVKMCSERVIGAQSGNSENLLGFYMGDGVTFLYQTGDEYKNIFPFWDWKKIPGATTPQDNKPLPVLGWYGYRIESNFVGGVSDGKTGIAAMDYNRNGLKAKKSWFIFDGKIVCLGAGISSSAGLPVTTSVNQSYLKGEPIIKTAAGEITSGGSGDLASTKWILHDNIGYFFPNGGNLKMETKEVEGSWSRVTSRYPDKKINARIFKLWLEHGVSPAGKSYAYILVPNATKNQLEDMEADNPFRIVNKKNLQVVASSDGLLAGITFFKPGKSDVFGGIEVNRPCLVMLKKGNDGVEVSIADPTQLLTDIQLSIHGEFQHGDALVKNGETKINIALPQNGEAGKSVTVFLKKL